MKDKLGLREKQKGLSAPPDIVPYQVLDGGMGMTLPDYEWLDVTELRHDQVFESGWSYLIGQLLMEIDILVAGTGTQVRLLQVKEKLGSLRFYHRMKDADAKTMENIGESIRRATHLSSQTCFRCGRPASMRNMTGWIVPLCDVHEETVADERG